MADGSNNSPSLVHTNAHARPWNCSYCDWSLWKEFFSKKSKTKMYAPITNFARLFFCLLKVLRPCLYGLGYPTKSHGEQLLATWALCMRIVPRFGLINTVKNFTKRSMEISLICSSRFPAHSKYEKNSLYTVVKFQEERHRCTEVLSHFARG